MALFIKGFFICIDKGVIFMPVQVKCFGNNKTVENVDSLLALLKSDYKSDHISIIETLPSGIKRPHYISVDAQGCPSYTYKNSQPFKPEQLNF